MLVAGCSPSPRQLQNFADDFVQERQEKWQGRTEQVASVTKGTKEPDILKHLGTPDKTSDSDTTKNWLYWLTASVNGGQLCADCLILKIENGVVVDYEQHTGYRQSIDDAYREKHQ